ncbi:hypothetical protein TM1040_0788 [Ruegeria sp. TM1040]|uniref:DUF2794 domain-containing protein n=1 Tax=Ruegeria sp. (strain TM1040) TaxID=292414 RepID=UPI0000553B94|nr:hypothetical protein TM1040_0788 [Ruegeria sp. TM1040]
MPIQYSLADRIFQTSKDLLPPFEWKPTTNGSGHEHRRGIECRVRIGGSMPRGVFFRIALFPRFRLRATFQLECERDSGRAHIPLYRLDVDPASAHQNKLFGPPEVHGIFLPQGKNHEHIFYDSLREDGGLRLHGAVQARPVEADFTEFSEALAYVCDTLKINNRGDLPPPGDQGVLL